MSSPFVTSSQVAGNSLSEWDISGVVKTLYLDQPVCGFQASSPVLHVWIGLDLFNDDTRPSGHISRPTQVNVSQSCFHFLNNYSKSDYIVHVWGAS